MHSHRGNSVCSNSLLVPQEVLESQLLHGLQATVLNPAVLNYTLKSFERQLLQQIENHAGETGLLVKKIADLKRKITNCTTAIAEGHSFGSLFDQLAVFETELKETKARLESMKPEGVRLRMKDIRRFVAVELCDLRQLLNTQPRLARAVFAKHIQKIVLTPQGGIYVAAGDWNLLGLGSYGGAGGPDRAVRFFEFCLPIAA